ncbi:protein amnionless [Maniola jurtina]|uniref:protein amnionless n=1 Tax=Maniola jurtina TaxID=191418 RepID=UPI001E68D9CA|nr:protein amnionless [Maniola jurtina]
MYREQLLIFVTFIATTLSANVVWLPNINFNLPINFNDGKIPCSKKTVVFPETMEESVLIGPGTSVAGFILPENGEIFLAEGEIGLGPTEDMDCTSGNVYYMEKAVASWAQPDVWVSLRMNDATPDAERVPCFDDIVEFPENSTFTILLPDVKQKVQAIKVGGETIYNNFKEYVLREPNDAQEFILNQFHDTGIVIGNYFKCNSRSGCPCQTNTLKIDCSTKYCEKPTCVDPIKPIGHCCKICGGAIDFDIDETFDIMNFQELVEKVVDSYGKDKLVYHIGRLVDDKVQVVVIDKNGYDQTSAQVVSAISYNMERNLRHEMQVSGSPLSKAGLGGKLFVSMFFAVVMVMAGIYVYYYKVSQINYPNIMSRSQASMFSRFNRRTESVVSLTRRDSSAPIGVSTATAFRNPLYDSKRGRVLVQESVIEE